MQPLQPSDAICFNFEAGLAQRRFALLFDQLERPLVIAKVDIALRWCGFTLRLALDLGAQRQHVAETFDVEFRVRSKSRRRNRQEIVGTLRYVAIELELVDQEIDGRRTVAAVGNETQG